MSNKTNLNPFTVYTSIAKTFFSIVVFLLFSFGIIGQIVYPDERDVINTDCRIFESAWEQTLEDGSKIPVNVPGNIQADYGEVVTLTTTLPQDIVRGECLCFRPVWQDVTVYVDGELRLDYNTKATRPFGTNSAMRYIFVELGETDSGKELTYQFSSNSKYAGNMGTSYIGDRLSIWMYLLKDSGIHMSIAIFLFLMSLFCIIVCNILEFIYKKPLPLKHLAWTIFFCAFWMLSEIAFRQVLVKNISILSCYAYWSLMLIPIPLLLFINDVQNRRYQKVYFAPIVYSAAMLVVGTSLQVFDIVQFVQQIPLIHAGLLVSIVCIIATITIDTFRRKISDYLFVGIGIYGMLFTAIIEMMFYYIRINLSLGTVLAIGLLFLLIMAIIKTGQDILRSEKKKQQAITAREAQAKFLANMSHEIRTPINAIIGMNEMILRENNNEAIRDYAHNIQNASNMLLGLINDVLDFSKIESGQLELIEDTYHLATLIQDEMLLLKTRISDKPITVQLDVDPRLPSSLRGDELRIKQVLTNLLSNAAKYTNEGAITLKAYFKQADEDNLELCFSVIDTGIGIKQEDLSQLFDSFKRLEITKNRTVEGTGLGLNIVKQLIDLMQGQVLVESEYGKGSTFTVCIPQKIMDKQPLVTLEASLSKYKKENHTTEHLFTAPDASILVVDDNSMNLTLMKELLKRTKVQVDLASSGRKCLELTTQKHYDIILMDHMMPECDGVETLHMLRADSNNPNQNTVVIVLTANAIAGCREMYLEYGFNDYFAKPVQADKLDTLLVQYLPRDLVHMENSAHMEASVHMETPVHTESSAHMETFSQSEENPTTVQSVTKVKEPSSDLLKIDYEKGKSYCLNSEDFYREMLSEFRAQANEYMPKLEQYFHKQDWKNYASITHGLKGAALNIGATNFSNLSLQHELAGKEENVDFITAGYADYVTALKALIGKIQDLA